MYKKIAAIFATATISATSIVGAGTLFPLSVAANATVQANNLAPESEIIEYELVGPYGNGDPRNLLRNLTPTKESMDGATNSTINDNIENAIGNILKIYKGEVDANFVIYIGSNACPYCRIMTDGRYVKEQVPSPSTFEHTYNGTIGYAAENLAEQGFTTYMYEDVAYSDESLPFSSNTRAQNTPGSNDDANDRPDNWEGWWDYYSAEQWQKLFDGTGTIDEAINSTPWIIVGKDREIVYQGGAQKYYDTSLDPDEFTEQQASVNGLEPTPGDFVNWINYEISFHWAWWMILLIVLGSVTLLAIVYFIWAHFRNKKKIQARKRMIEKKLSQVKL